MAYPDHTITKMKFTKLLTAIAICFVFVASAVLSASFASADYAYTTRWSYAGNPVTNVRAINYVCSDSGCNTLGLQTTDVNSGTSNSVLVVYPVPASANGYATYWMSPGYRMQEMAWRPTSNGASTQNVNFSKYPNCVAAINSVNAPATVNEGQALSVVVNVDSAWDEANVAPYSEPADADIVRDYLSARTNVTLTIRDAGNNVVYTNTLENYVRENNNLNYNFQWTPNATQSGAYTITATTNVVDSKCSSASSQTSTPSAVTVNDVFVNQAPVLNAIGNKSVVVGVTLAFVVTASDPDGDALTYTSIGLPVGASYSPVQLFTWAPNAGDVGIHTVTFTVNDGSLQDTETITITVLNGGANHAPVLNAIGNKVVEIGSSLNFSVNATDADGDALTYSAGVLPSGAVFNAGTRTFSWIPTLSQTGNYSVQFNVTDIFGALDFEAITISVVKKTAPLSISISPSNSVVNGTRTNATGFGCPAELTCTLYRNGAAVNNSDIGTFAVGNYGYVYNTTGNENYSAVSVSANLNVYNPGSDDDDDDSDSNDIIIIDDDDFRNGYTVTLNIGDRAKFTFCGAPYYLKLTDIDTDDDQAYFTLNPGLRNFVLDEDERLDLDLNDDGIKDVEFKLTDIVSDDKVKVYIKRLSNNCQVSQEPTQELEVYGEQTQVLAGKKSSSTMSSLLLMVFGGILLLILAIILILLSRANKRKPNANPSFPVK